MCEFSLQLPAHYATGPPILAITCFLIPGPNITNCNYRCCDMALHLWILPMKIAHQIVKLTKPHNRQCDSSYRHHQYLRLFRWWLIESMTWLDGNTLRCPWENACSHSYWQTSSSAACQGKKITGKMNAVETCPLGQEQRFPWCSALWGWRSKLWNCPCIRLSALCWFMRLRLSQLLF